MNNQPDSNHNETKAQNNVSLIPLEHQPSDKKTLIKHAIIFQGKLSLDALRDILLSPVSLICLCIDLYKGFSPRDSLYFKLMQFGHKTDRWLNLFGGEHEPKRQVHVSAQAIEKENNGQKLEEESIDEIIQQFEQRLSNIDHRGITSKTRAKIQRYVVSLANAKKADKEH